MNIYKSISLPPVEYERLQHLMLTMIGSRTVLASVLRRKLGSSAPATGDVRGDTAISGSKVHYIVDGAHEGVATLTWRPKKRDDGAELSLQSPRGLALLGLGPGDSFSYAADGGALEFIEVQRVVREPSGASTRSLPATTTPDPVVLHHAARVDAAFSGGLNA
jgi:hypothetical protein